MSAGQLEQRIQVLTIYTQVVTILLGILAFFVFKQVTQKRKFAEIDVERLNIVEQDGQLRMVISNKERQHPGQVDGEPIPRPDGRAPGLIFFNERGDECGGLSFDSGVLENGITHNFGSLTFDKFRQDQTIGLQHLEGNGQYFAGLTVWDRPDTSLAEFIEMWEGIEQMPEGAEKQDAIASLKRRGEFGTQRILVGRERDQSATIALSDAEGHPRLKIVVDADGNAQINFLDQSGQVTLCLPEDLQNPQG